jgi:hypothetical protein
MRRLFLLLFAATLFSGCTTTNAPSVTATPTPLSKAHFKELRLRMNDAFAGLEIYASDNSQAYPDNLDVLIPRYLDAVPIDPVSGKPIVYEKTEEGFQLGASGDYAELGAEPGFPKMNQDGFYERRAKDFPKYD